MVASSSDYGIYCVTLNRWLAGNKTLNFYDIRTGDAVEFKRRHRPLRVCLMDGATKTALIDDTAPVSQIVLAVCERIGISNPEEYSLQTDASNELNSSSSNISTLSRPGTLKRSKGMGSREAMNEEGRWLNHEKTLAEQGVGESDMLWLKKKFFFSDQNVDQTDPIQLNLLFVQTRDAILDGTHPVTFEEAMLLAALQFQVQHGNHEPDKHKSGYFR